MSLVEGTPFHCYIHDFETRSVEEWNEHCYGNPEHTEQGTAVCPDCGTPFRFEGLPYHKIGPDGSKNILLKCEDCETKSLGQVKRVKS